MHEHENVLFRWKKQTQQQQQQHEVFKKVHCKLQCTIREKTKKKQWLNQLEIQLERFR